MNEHEQAAAELLDAAADELELHGHTKGTFGVPAGPKCLLGALHYANMMTNVTRVAFIGACNALAAEVDVPVSKLVIWNDAEATTTDDVINGLRFTAKRLRRDEMTDIATQAADALDAAADVIETRGWTRGRYEHSTGEVCVLGALNVALTNDAHGVQRLDDEDLEHRAYVAARQTLANVVGRMPTAWNDADGRTKFEVIDACKTAAKLLRDEQETG